MTIVMNRREFLQSLGVSAIVLLPTTEQFLLSLGATQSNISQLNDYAFSPGATNFDKRGRQFSFFRPDTCLIVTNTQRLDSFIAYLNSPTAQLGTSQCGPQVTRTPIPDLRQLLLVTHANNEGRM